MPTPLMILVSFLLNCVSNFLPFPAAAALTGCVYAAVSSAGGAGEVPRWIMVLFEHYCTAVFGKNAVIDSE